MKTWQATIGAALELTERTKVRHSVYKSTWPVTGWFISKLDNPGEGYKRHKEEVASKWRAIDESIVNR